MYMKNFGFNPLGNAPAKCSYVNYLVSFKKIDKVYTCSIRHKNKALDNSRIRIKYNRIIRIRLKCIFIMLFELETFFFETLNLELENK